MELLKDILSIWIPAILAIAYIPLSLSLVAYRKDRKILQNDINNIKENLNNHVTDTNKKIDKLNEKLDEKFNKTDSKIDQLRTDMHTKIDSNFSNILTVLGLPKKMNQILKAIINNMAVSVNSDYVESKIKMFILKGDNMKDLIISKGSFISKVKLLCVLFIPFLSYGQEWVSVCDRTPQVEVAIMDIVHETAPSLECSDDDLVRYILPEILALDLTSERITGLKKGDFSGLSSLHTLDLFDNNLTSLPEGIFSGLTSLRNLYLGYNYLTSLPEGIFSGLPSLNYLSIYNNDLTSLPEGGFSSLSSLHTLDLFDNGLTSLPEGVFSGLSSLLELSLRSNGLSSLPEGIFSGLSSLQLLFLTSNGLTSLPEGVFSGLSSLQWLFLEKNFLDNQTRRYLKTLNIKGLRL